MENGQKRICRIVDSFCNYEIYKILPLTRDSAIEYMLLLCVHTSKHLISCKCCLLFTD